MEHLFDKLWENGESEIYPYHMPGHKRRGWGQLPRAMYQADITEIDGFDNLHQPEGLLLKLQEAAARLYGAEESFYLVNGSTAGILSAVSCALPQGGHILISRNCHKSVYHAAYLRNLNISYLYPAVLQEYDIFDGVTAKQVREALENEPDIGAVLVVSPTYEGRISDIRAIAEVVHQKGIPLIVDEAHGAHLGLAAGFSQNSCQAGADLVIHSVHKTLPALTQTALLHVNGELINREYMKRFLHIYQTSSPSYLLMASIDNALRYVEKDGAAAFSGFQERFLKMTERLSGCKHLRILPAEECRQDIGKLVISVKGTGLTGKQLYDILLNRYKLQPEMAAESFVLAMFTVNDSEEGYARMERALLEIDGALPDSEAGGDSNEFPYTWQNPGGDSLPIASAWEADRRSVELCSSVGCYAGEFVNLYPPGVPLLVPGEQITEELCRNIEICMRQGLTVQGIKIRKEKVLIQVLRERSGFILGKS